jgi:hypothetical protein
MGQFTLYDNPNRESKDAYPYFVDVQNSHFGVNKDIFLVTKK